MRNPVPYRVECKNPPPFAGYEIIAAFNVDCVAERYARECKKTNPRNEYRVTRARRVNGSPQIIYSTETE